MSELALLERLKGLGPIHRRADGTLTFNRPQAILVARHTFVVAYAEMYGAKRGVVDRKHADDIARGIQMGVMQDSPGVLLADWYDEATYQLAVDAMALVAENSPGLFR